MISGMTGYGRAKDSSSGVYVEIKSVNHRFCEVKTSLPKQLSFLEIEIAKLIKKSVIRGYFSVYLGGATEELLEPKIKINKKILNNYVAAAIEINKEISAISGKEPHLPAADRFMRMDGVLENLAEAPTDKIWKSVEPLIQQAVASVKQMREAEGKATYEALKGHLIKCDTIFDEINIKAPATAKAIKERLEKNLNKTDYSFKIDKERLEQEVAMIAERADITEELNRAKAHVNEFLKLLDKDASKGAGRKLDFILQELNRETNTIASKTQNQETSMNTVELKSEIEKAREQVQNIE